MKKILIFLALSAAAYGQAVFPGRAATDSDLYTAQDQAQSTLTGSINASTLTIPVASGTVFAAYNILTVDSEQMKVCSVSSNTVTICTGGRGFAGTTATTHSSGAGIYNYVSSIYHKAMSDEMKSVESWLLAGAENSISVSAFGAKGDCTTDDTAAIQSALNTHQYLIFPKPAGGCYLVSNTLTIYDGDYLYGQSGMIPDNANQGVVIKLAAAKNVPVLQTYVAPLGQGNEYMGLENIVVDGNGPSQTSELPAGEACLDFRGGQIMSQIKHVMVKDCFGSALSTGNAGGDTLLEDVWLFGASTSTYQWVHNWGITPGATAGTIDAQEVFVEDQGTPVGGVFRNASASPNFGDPSTYSHAIYINGGQNINLQSIHCESALTCVDINKGQAINIAGISGTRIGNPSDADPTNQYLVRIMDANVQHVTMSSAHFDQSGTTYGGSFSTTRILGLANGISSADWYQTPTNYTEWPFYTHGQFFGGGGYPYLGERPVVGNEFWVQAIGGYSPNAIRMWDNAQAPNGTNWYWERGSSSTMFGYGPGPYQSNEQDFLKLLWFGTNKANNAVEIPGQQLWFQSPDATKTAVWQEDNDGDMKITGGARNLLWYSPNAFFGLPQGNNSTGAGVNFQALNSSPYFIRGQFGSDIVYDGAGNWDIGSQGASDYESIFFVNGGGFCSSASDSVAQPSTITDGSYWANTKWCVSSAGHILLNPTFNASHVPNDNGSSIQGVSSITTSSGASGLSVTKTVQGSAGACTMTFTAGLLTATTCP